MPLKAKDFKSFVYTIPPPGPIPSDYTTHIRYNTSNNYIDVTFVDWIKKCRLCICHALL